jgi:hypothetical protein
LLFDQRCVLYQAMCERDTDERTQQFFSWVTDELQPALQRLRQRPATRQDVQRIRELARRFQAVRWAIQAQDLKWLHRASAAVRESAHDLLG